MVDLFHEGGETIEERYSVDQNNISLQTMFLAVKCSQEAIYMQKQTFVKGTILGKSIKQEQSHALF